VRVNEDWRTNPIASYRHEFENVYYRFATIGKMQRIDYADAVVMKWEWKMNTIILF